MNMMNKIIDVVLPRFAATNAHWRMLSSVLCQNYENFNVIIGAKPDAVDEIINFTNEYRYNHECLGLNKVLVITDVEELERDDYLLALRNKGDGDISIVLKKEYIFSSSSSLSLLIEENEDVLDDADTLQTRIEKYTCKNRPRNLSSVIYISDNSKDKIFKIRAKLFKFTRFENILHSMVISAFLIVAAVFVNQEVQNPDFYVDILIALSIVSLIITLVRTILHIAIAIFDKRLEDRRRRKESK